MIKIDHISFEFVAPDEPFAQNLYADWDSFCHDCFEKVVEECLSGYDKDKVLHEIERLDLNVGNIPEEDFYKEFPRRLREELLRTLPSFQISAEDRDEKTGIARFENLLFYLVQGYPKVEWADEDFNLTEELGWAILQSAQYTNEIVKLCMSKEYALCRLLWQTDDEASLLLFYTAALSEHTFGQYEKRRFLGRFLETKPGIPVHYVHEAAGDTELYGMADLLDTVYVRQIMETEAEEHAEVDLPPYWHYLYEWLIRYYPFNGLAIFGGKGEFTRHLHFRLLTFIRGRNYSYYLSKAELTRSFLLEIFGPAYYIEVLNAIYNLQPHHPDGSPVFDDYFSRELYRIFLQLSFLQMPAQEETTHQTSTEILTAYLKDIGKSKTDKRMLLEIWAKEKPEIVVKWLQAEVAKDNQAVFALISVLAEMADDTIINRLLASLSFMAMEIAQHIKTYLRIHTTEINWLNGVPESRQNLIFRKAILLWIGNGYASRPESESTKHLLHLIYRETTGSDKEDAILEIVSAKLLLSEKDWEQFTESKNSSSSAAFIRKLKILLEDKNAPESMKCRMLVSFLEQSGDNYADAILQLHDHGLLEHALEFINQPILEEIIRQSIVRLNGTDKATEQLTLLYWLVIHETYVSSYLQDKTQGLKVQLLLWLAKVIGKQPDAKRTETEILPSLLTALFGKENISFVIGLVFRVSTKETEAGETNYYNMEMALNFLPDVGQSQGQSPGGFAAWLEDTTVSPESKHERLLKLAVEKPKEWLRLFRKLPAENKTLSLVAPHLSAPQLLQSMERADFRQASVLSQTVEWIQRKADNLAILTGNNILLSTALSKALLLYMQDKDTLGGRALTESETVDKFLSYLYLIYTGKPDYRNNEEWADLSGKMAADMKTDSQQEIQDKKIADTLLQQDIGDTLRLPIERIADSTLPENIRRRWLYGYLRSQPKELLDYIRQSVEHNILPLSKWLEWLEIKDWMRLATNLSLSKAELLQQIIDGLSESNRIKEADLCTALATCLIKNSAEEWIYNNKEETVRSFVQSLPAQKEKTEAEKEETAKLITLIINSMKPEDYSPAGEEKKVPENFSINNAGLCLLSPWMPRLFAMLDYLDDNKRMFKDTASQIRAIFLIQYLVRSEENEYRETELIFNRLLVNLPMNISLPRSLELTDNEKQIAQDMMNAVKANWSKMRNTSLRGFQDTFIYRTGRMEQQDSRWVLTIEKRAYDVLLDSIPWSFRQIRYPWLEKYIEVIWKGEQRF